MRFLFIIVGVIIVAGAAWFLYVREEGVGSPADKSIPPRSFMSERVELKTQDGVQIIGDYYPAESSRGILLLHMMPADRKSWTAFAAKLQAAGFQALAIDLRGHGESEGGPDGYKKFSDAEHQASQLDVEAGAEFLKSKGVTELHLAGASIGANLALKYLSERSEARSAILLSPGLDYRGVLTAPALEKISPTQGIYLAAAEDDGYSRDTVAELSRKIIQDNRHMLKVFKSGGHGTRLFEAHPEFMEELATWLERL